MPQAASWPPNLRSTGPYILKDIQTGGKLSILAAGAFAKLAVERYQDRRTIKFIRYFRSNDPYDTRMPAFAGKNDNLVVFKIDLAFYLGKSLLMNPGPLSSALFLFFAVLSIAASSAARAPSPLSNSSIAFWGRAHSPHSIDARSRG